MLSVFALYKASENRLFIRVHFLHYEVANGIVILLLYMLRGQKFKAEKSHSSINVSLTYLRGLEIAELKEEDMPMV